MRETMYPIQRGLTSPCRTIENVDVQKLETDAVNLGPEQHFHKMKIHGKYWKQWFGVTYSFFSDKFTMKINKKEMDFESLVGYIGGYVGLFAGFAVIQVPGVLSNWAIITKRLYITLVYGREI